MVYGRSHDGCSTWSADVNFDDYVVRAEENALCCHYENRFSSLDIPCDCKQDIEPSQFAPRTRSRSMSVKRCVQSSLLVLCFAVVALNDAQAASPAGQWNGSWHSQPTGHKGTLRAKIRQTQPGTYQAVFYGRFAKVIPFIYPAKLQHVPGTCNCYTSSQRLPLLGTYKMSATVTDQRFYATFGGKKDAGTFDMSR